MCVSAIVKIVPAISRHKVNITFCNIFILVDIITESEIMAFASVDHLRRQFFLYFRFECLVEYIRYGLCDIDVT